MKDVPGIILGGTDAATAVGTMPTEQPLIASEPETDVALWAVVFAGGIGSRFWPLSTPARPKPLLALVSEQTLIEDTVGRLQPTIPPERVLILTSRDIAPAIRSVTKEVPEENVLVEPRPLGTAAALAWAAQEMARRIGPSAMLVAVHADLAVDFPEEFRRTLRRAAAYAAREQALVSVGIRPSRPETGFGYVLPGAPLDGDVPLRQGGAAVTRGYVEKPSEAEAESRIEDGALWHSGILVGAAGTVLEQMRRHTVEVRDALEPLAAGDLPAFVGRVRATSLERGLLERSDRLLVLLGEFGWDDVGTWASLRRARELDDDGNGASGTVHFVDADCNVVHAGHGSVVMYGVSRMLVVTLDGLTFVTTLDRAADLRPLLDALPGSMRIAPTGGK
ncbi:MAG: NTP transferase domain-containing protein [Gemmatimonadaceae bacterium]|nr:NTP transferase domain-containing protein [Gemmatimonadaceae bacterium]